MKRGLLSSLAIASFTWAASAQYSTNVVGYYNLTIHSGDNLIANELDTGSNTLNNVLHMPQGMTGATFSEWDPTSNQLLPSSIFNGMTWSIDYSLAPDGTGGVLHSLVSGTIGTDGQVPYLDLITENSTYVPPERGPGVYLLASAFPYQAADFQQVIGRDPIEGEWVKTLDASTQTYHSSLFHNGFWDNGVPSLTTDQSAYFGLMEIPEPSVSALAVGGAMMVCLLRHKRRPGTASRTAL